MGLTIEEVRIADENGWDRGFIVGLSDNEIVVDESDLVELVTYEKPDGGQMHVDTALGGGVGGYYVFSRSATGKRGRFKTIKCSESLRLAQNTLNEYAAQKGFRAVGASSHPNCISKRVIRGIRRVKANSELRDQLGSMSFELFCECFPDGFFGQSSSVLDWTESHQVNLYLDIFTGLVLSGRYISDVMINSLLKRPERIRESKSWPCSTGKLVGLSLVVEYIDHFDEINYRYHQPNQERDQKFRMGKSNWECMNKKERAYGMHIHELHGRVQKLWSQCQEEREPVKVKFVQVMFPGMERAASVGVTLSNHC